MKDFCQFYESCPLDLLISLKSSSIMKYICKYVVGCFCYYLIMQEKCTHMIPLTFQLLASSTM